MMSEQAIKPGVLIVVENVPVLIDRRVLQECRTLVAAGYGVSVICPMAVATAACSSVIGQAID